MKAISLFNRYLVPILFIIVLASSVTGCHVLHHGHGGHYSSGSYQGQHGHQAHDRSKAGHRARRY